MAMEVVVVAVVTDFDAKAVEKSSGMTEDGRRKC